MSYYYLSQPYSGTAAQMQERYLSGAKACLQFLKSGLSVFSPIVHNHSLLKMETEFLPQQQRDLFISFDLNMLVKAEAMIVLTLEGWEQSLGVKLEMEFCEENKKPIHYIELASILRGDYCTLSSAVIA